MEYGSTILYKKWVIDPLLETPINERESIFRLAGFNGCIGSSDATHIPLLSCPYWAQNNHKGFKLSHPARTYNVTVDHTKRILGTTGGHPGTWNDKTLVLFDKLITKVKNGELYNDYEFKLYERNTVGEIVEVVYKGVWFMVDNGYLSWSCTVPPDGNGVTYEIIRFSEWLESMRKDVECLFGIMKGRFLILRYGIRFHKIVMCDKLWVTCCAMHNMLLDIDDLRKNWQNGAKSDWEIFNNDHKNRSKIRTPFAINRLHRHQEMEDTDEDDEYDSYVDNNTDISKICDKYSSNGKRIVSRMPLSLFRQCLINHFDIRYKKNDIVWPRNVRKI